MEELRLKILTVVSLTCVGRRGGCTQSKDVMFQCNKDLFLFSLGEEQKTKRSTLTWEQRYAVAVNDN